MDHSNKNAGGSASRLLVQIFSKRPDVVITDSSSEEDKQPTATVPAVVDERSNATQDITREEDADVIFISQKRKKVEDEDVVFISQKNINVENEQMRKRLSSTELSIVRIAFVKLYPNPPSNLKVMGRYQFSTIRDMDKDRMNEIYNTFLKPWGDKWWELYFKFNDDVRRRKLAKFHSVNPTITEEEATSWAEEFYSIHGSAKPEDSSLMEM